MYRRIHWLAVTLLLVGLSSSCDNRRDASRSGADENAGSTLKTPGDSVRLEDTLSAPPASKDTTRR
jgi:hypothetical protein